MNDLSKTIGEGLIHYFRDFQQRVHTLADQLTEEQFSAKPYAYGNSIGNLVLHLTGNLSYYIGAQIANNGYIRNRDLEFTARYVGQKAETLKKLDEAVETVIETLRSQTAEDWGREYTAVGVDDVKDRFGIYLRCAVHFHHHIGQMIYLVKDLNLKISG